MPDAQVDASLVKTRERLLGEVQLSVSQERSQAQEQIA
jgi:hypothetical protein